MEKDWLSLWQRQKQLDALRQAGKAVEGYGLSLSEQETALLIEEHGKVLKEQGRVEFGEGILPKLIYEFCDSVYIYQDNYLSTILKLQEIFYLFKNEVLDELTDDEILHFMKEQFETVCFGDLEYLEGTCLAVFSRAVRAGYEGYKAGEGRGEYEQFDEVPRWDYGLYLAALQDLVG